MAQFGLARITRDAVGAGPAFRERLPQRLWALVQQGNGGDRDDRLD